ncbi:disease resistance RPP13-like protein 4 [Chenopodium quinoa]|uniref:Disease resistance RPP13-like protein 4 n=1 Tax=Chenopodium quinoa TaxID=63459 RepID=A0A803LRR4_CHEQI|nr:disease resistance RPP13-like protein 4 [Chenopodium quinoa]
MVDAVVSVCLERLFKVLVKEGNVLLGYRDQFQKVQTDLQYMKSFFKDAERLKRKDEVLKCTLADLRELVYEVEDILAECQLLSDSSGKLLHGFSPIKVPSKYQMGKRLGEISEKITSIRNNILTFLGPLSQSIHGNAQEDGPPRWSSPIYDHTQVVGLEGDTKKLKDWLFQVDNSGILSIGVVGMGGLGKTTVAQTVFNEKEVELHFEKRIWVSVSQKFSEDQIMRSILRNLGDVNVGDDRGDLLKRINQYLLGKRFLIVLDDVWSEDTSWWTRIFAGLPKGIGGCIIVTTRIENVARKMGVQEARIHQPKVLSEGHSWSLFCNVAFAEHYGTCTSTELECVGKEIVSKCKGLPLAIKAVGGMMLCKPPYYREWRRIADHFREELTDLEDNSVMASLQCSYDELPSYLKSCLLSLSIYPEDCEISKDQLVRWWIGEGFVPVRNGRLATEASEDCFSGLTNRCLVEVVEWEYNGKISTCKVHDMVRDLVIQIANDESFSGLSAAHRRHLGLTTDIKEKEMVTSKKLRALISTSKSGEVNKIASCVGSKFCDFKYLRVLDLSKSIFGVSLASLLDKIGNLKHLTCFNLNNTHPLTQVPLTLEKLHNLQILDLSYCQSLRSLPPFVMTFENLLVLDVSHCGSLEFLPRGLEKLSNLQVLLGFKPAKVEGGGSRFSELRSLSQLRILELQLTRADEIDDGETDALNGLKEMQILTISCFNSFESDKVISKLEKICPPMQLHELSLKLYPGKISPRWLNPASLPMLRYLSMCGGNLAQLNKSFWGNDETTWKIKGLKLDSLSHLNLKWEMIQRVMPSLSTVHACWSPELTSFPIEGVGFRGGVWKQDRNS